MKKYIIQCNLMAESQLLDIRNAVSDIPHQYVGLIPFSRELMLQEPLDGNDYIPYGSTLLTTIALEQFKWTGLYFDLENFNYQKAVSNRDDMLNQDHIFTIKNAIDFLKSRPSKEDWFIRPSLDLKQFSGTVLGAKECFEWMKDAIECDSSGSYKLAEDTIVVLSKPQDIKAEWRWFIVDGKVISGSMYRCNGFLRKEHVSDKELIEEAQSIADKWLPNPCCVMDLALVSDKLKVIEFNGINSSGFYNHDIKKVFTTLYNFGG